MKTFTTTLALALATLTTTPAFAHGGHTATVDGHTHSLLDLALISAGPAALIAVGIFLTVQWVSRRND